jgi:hypothetical protein
MFLKSNGLIYHRLLASFSYAASGVRGILLLLPALLVLTACGASGTTSPGSAVTVSPAAAQTACEVRDFEATILQGKDAGTSVQGTLTLQANTSGHLTTQLKSKDGKTIPGSGQVTGQAISLFFDLGDGKSIFGTGTLDHDFAACTGALGGTLAGPDRTDTGAWGCSCCPCYIRTISPTLGLEQSEPLRASSTGRVYTEERATIKGHLTRST